MSARVISEQGLDGKYSGLLGEYRFLIGLPAVLGSTHVL
jgi:hypothetical protein